jgi:HD superfamily phosphohydrolase
LEGNLSVAEYLLLDEALLQTTFARWAEEADPVLADLSERFLNRRLFKYTPADNVPLVFLERIRAALAAAGWDPTYYLEMDFPSDLPYDVYRPGESDEKLPILLLGNNEELVEISRRSEIVRSISGIHAGQNQLYYPGELLAAPLPEDIREFLLHGSRDELS